MPAYVDGDTIVEVVLRCDCREQSLRDDSLSLLFSILLHYYSFFLSFELELFIRERYHNAAAVGKCKMV